MSILDNCVGYTAMSMAEGLTKRVGESRAFFVALDSLVSTLHCESSQYSRTTKDALFHLHVCIGMWSREDLSSEGLEEEIYKFCHKTDDRVVGMISHFANTFIRETASMPERSWK